MIIVTYNLLGFFQLFLYDFFITCRDLDRIEEGDIMVLEKLKEENVARGSYSR